MDDKKRETNLDQLAQGLFALYLEKQMSEPEYYVIDRQTHRLVFVSRRHSYANDVKRLLKELKINASQIKAIEFSAEDAEFQPEELINYHLGHFFDLVHQLKDKIYQLVRLLLIEETPANPSREPGPDPLKRYFRKEETKTRLAELGLTDELAKWKEEDKDRPIGKTLGRRTIHHHYLAKLELTKEFQDIRASRIMQGNDTARLSEYGQKYMQDLGMTSFTKFKQEVIETQTGVLEEINSSIEAIAGALVSGLAIPNDVKAIGQTMMKYADFMGSFKIENEASLDKISKPQRAAVDQLVQESLSSKEIAAEIKAVFLVGSVGRDEFHLGVSDFNFYIITQRQIEWSMHDYPLNLIVIDEEAFMSEVHLKDRFICWSDGIQVYGEPIKFDQREFPRPGTGLTILLNEGYIERLNTIKSELSDVDPKDVATIRALTLSAVKIMIDFDFGAAMANDPMYAASREKKIAHTNKEFKNPKRTTELVRILNSQQPLKKEDLWKLIDIYIEQTEANYNKMLRVIRGAEGASDEK